MKKRKIFYTTKEVAGRLGLPVSTIMYWVREFGLRIRQSGSLSSLNKGGNYQFTEDNFKELEAIRLLVHEQGKSLQRAKEELKQGASSLERKAELLTTLRSCLARLEDLQMALEQEGMR